MASKDADTAETAAPLKLVELDEPEEVLNAQEMDPNAPGLWSAQMRRNWFCVMFAIFALASNGYDAALPWFLPNLPIFQTDISGIDNYSLASINVANQIGQFIAPFFYTPIFDGWGRKKGVMFGSVFAFIGICVQIFGTMGPHKQIAYLAGRMINQFGVAIAGAVANMFIMETAHPAWRAFFGGLFGAVWVWGMYAAQLVVFIVTFAPENSWQWRGPLMVQLVWVFILFYMYFHVPESPRFLVSRGRDAEAKAVIVKWMAHDDETNPLVEHQYNDLKANIIDYTNWNWRVAYNPMPLFATANMRRRMLILIVVNPIWGILNSAPTGGVFETNIYALMGVNNASVKQGMDIGGSIFTVLGAYFGSFGPERYGRRKLQFWGYLGSAIFIVFQAIGMDLFGRFGGIGWAALFFGSRYVAGFWSSFVVAPSANLFIDELMPYEGRAKVLWLLQVVGALIGIGQSYLQAYMLNWLGNEVYWWVVGFSFFQWFTVWWLFPETKGRTLEQIGAIFDHPNPVKYSLQVLKQNEDFQKAKKAAEASSA